MKNVLQPKTSLFRPASKDTLELIRTLNQEKQYTFLMPTKFISPEAGEVGYLLDQYFNLGRSRDQCTSYRTFFGNSRKEAIHGAIKIARHNAFKRDKNHPRETLIYDPAQEWKYCFNPLGREEAQALVGGIGIVNQKEQLFGMVKNRYAQLCGLILPAHEGLTADFASDLFHLAVQGGITTILDESKSDLNIPQAFIHTLKALPDVVVTAENLTDYEIPFGAFSMSTQTHRAWTSMQTCFIHSSTFGGNRLALTKARNHLLNPRLSSKDHSTYRKACKDIEDNHKKRLAAFSRYVNPATAGFLKINGFDFHPARAHGSIFTYGGEDKRVVMDCIAGGAAAVRGHTPEDIVSGVLDEHNEHIDYWEKLKNKMSTLTGLSHALPAVSGATAVENGITMAMLANHRRTRIVTFKSNYAGKTLIALNASDVEDLDIRTPFHPLYFDVVYIDPFQKDAAEKLRRELTSGHVALVWFEIIQGGTEQSIPAGLIEMIGRYKGEGAYFVGIDEILAGFYRTGHVFTYQGARISPDIVTFSKALSDGTYPMGMTLVSRPVYDRALSYRPDAVMHLEHAYVNQLGSHIAYHCVGKLTTSYLGRHVQRVSDIIQTGLNDIAKDSSIIKEVGGKGLLLHIHYRFDHPFMKCLGKVGRLLFPLYMGRTALKEAGVFLFFDRCMPALTMSEHEAETLVQNLKRIFTRNLWVTYFGFCGYIMKLSFFSIINLIREIGDSALFLRFCFNKKK